VDFRQPRRQWLVVNAAGRGNGPGWSAGGGVAAERPVSRAKGARTRRCGRRAGCARLAVGTPVPNHQAYLDEFLRALYSGMELSAAGFVLWRGGRPALASLGV